MILDRIHLSSDARNSIIVVPYWGLLMPAVTKVSKSPTFTLSPSSLMQGGFGAITTNAFKNSQEAAKIAAQILTGTPVSSIPIRESNYEMVFDNKQLKFFHVERDRLPQSAHVINQTYMEKYGTYIILFYILVVLSLIAWVVRLFVINRREARKRMQAQTRLLIQSRLVEQRNEFDNVFHSIPDAVVTYDNEFKIHFVNRATLQMAGVSELIEEGNISPYEGQMAGGICKLFYNGEEILLAMLKKVGDEGLSLSIPDGAFVQSMQTQKFFPVSGEVLPILSHGKQTGLAITFRNISQQALQKRFFSLDIEESSIYPWHYEQDISSFVFPSGYISRMGFEHTTVYRKEMDGRIHPEDLEHTVGTFDKAIKKQLQNVRFTFRQMNAEEVYEWWEFRVSAIRGVTEEVPFSVLGVCQSIQQFKNTEEELISARDKALEADKLKSAFLANMSHEIRTPLNAIVGFSDLLKDIHLFTEEEIQSFIATINKNCELLLALINDVLDLSRVESGAMDFQFSPYYLPIIIEEVYDSQLLNIPTEVELIMIIPEGSDRTIITDSLRVKQVLNNLINNAVKFTSKGFIKFGYMEDEEEFTTFFVTDTGTGISRKNQGQIFERFYKVDNFTQGAGLGLSICQTIVNRLHGSIWVESELGEGTTFFVRVPNEIE
ncbi:MAG: ATP-binding protein [Bacteroides sp.]|nr:ATP-binding protein [Bacteroides sp.]